MPRIKAYNGTSNIMRLAHGCFERATDKRQQTDEITNGLATQLNRVSNPFVFDKKLGHFRIKSGRVTTRKR